MKVVTVIAVMNSICVLPPLVKAEKQEANSPCCDIFFAGDAMGADKSVEITGLLKAWGTGDQGALERLTELVYQELRRMARRYLRNERLGNSLQATALVNEVYLRLIDVKNVDWRERAQFFALSAELMRHILVDAARARCSHKRGGAAVRVEFDEAVPIPPEPDRFILALEGALEALAKSAPRQAKVVELRYFGGLTEEETAEVLRTSPRTVQRDWQFAKAWLTRALNDAEWGGPQSVNI